jgi:hypothetical protein
MGPNRTGLDQVKPVLDQVKPVLDQTGPNRQRPGPNQTKLRPRPVWTNVIADFSLSILLQMLDFIQYHPRTPKMVLVLCRTARYAWHFFPSYDE